MAYKVVAEYTFIVKRIILSLLAIVLFTAVLPARSRRTKAVPLAEPQAQPSLSLPEQRLFDSLYFEALSLELLGRSGEAMEHVNKALEVNPNSAPALFFRSRQYASRKQYVEALDDANKALEIDTTNVWYATEAAHLWMQRGAFQKALLVYESLHRQHPQHVQTLYRLADLYYRVDSLPQLVKILDEIEVIDGINPDLTMQKFYMLKQMGRQAEGFEAVEKVIARYPFQIDYRIQLGDLLMQDGQMQRAKKVYDEAARLDPDNAYVWVAQSNYFSVMGDQLSADTLVNSALVHPNLDIDTKIEILTEYLKNTLRKIAKEKQEAQDTTAIEIEGVDELFNTVAAMHPTAPEVYDLHASYLNVVNKDSLAAVQERFAVDLRPSESNYWVRLLDYISMSGDMQALKQCGQEAYQRHPAEPMVYSSIAFAYYNENQLDSVIYWYKKGIENISTKDVNALSTLYGALGDIYSQQDSMSACFECYDLALKYNDRNYVVLNNYAYYLSTCENANLEKAERMAAKVVQQYPNNPTYLDTYAWIFYLQGNYMLAKFYQQRAIELSGEGVEGTLKEHWDKILEAADGKKE